MNLEENPGDLSNEDHGGIIQRDAEGRLYVDVVLHNKNDASDNPLADPWDVLEPSATYTLCVRKSPANIAAAAATPALPSAAAAAAARLRGLTTLEPWWDNEDDDATWIWLGEDWIHARFANRTMHTHTHTPDTPVQTQWAGRMPIQDAGHKCW